MSDLVVEGLKRVRKRLIASIDKENHFDSAEVYRHMSTTAGWQGKVWKPGFYREMIAAYEAAYPTCLEVLDRAIAEAECREESEFGEDPALEDRE